MFTFLLTFISYLSFILQLTCLSPKRLKYLDSNYELEQTNQICRVDCSVQISAWYSGENREAQPELGLVWTISLASCAKLSESRHPGEAG